VARIAKGSLAETTGGIEVRDEVTHINGAEVHDHASATALVRGAAREVVFGLRRTPTSMPPDVQRRMRQQRVLDAMHSNYRA
jgi:C-terminal processing protease CtpA/Prc